MRRASLLLFALLLAGATAAGRICPRPPCGPVPTDPATSPVCRLHPCAAAAVTDIGRQVEQLQGDARAMAGGDPDAVFATLQAVNDDAHYALTEDLALATMLSAGADRLGVDGAVAVLVPLLRAQMQLQQRGQGQPTLTATLAALDRVVQSDAFTADGVVGAFALCNAWDALGEVHRAMAVCRAANRAVAARVSAAQTASVINFVRAFGQGTPFAGMQPAAAPAPGHGTGVAFVTGVPRSGSTMVEQMLGMLPGVAPQGERPVLQTAVWAHLKREVPDSRSVGVDVIRGMLDEPAYRARVAARVREHVLEGMPPGARMVVNKAMNVAPFAPLLLRLLPDARLVYVQRDVRDVALGLFRQAFEFNAQGLLWATEPELIREFLAAHAQAWAAALADPFVRQRVLVVRYEELAREPERVMRGSVLPFLGLDWDPAVLRFHESARSPGTSSNDQVREPAHTRNIDRWKPYEQYVREWFGMPGVERERVYEV